VPSEREGNCRTVGCPIIVPAALSPQPRAMNRLGRMGVIRRRPDTQPPTRRSLSPHVDTAEFKRRHPRPAERRGQWDRASIRRFVDRSKWHDVRGRGSRQDNAGSGSDGAARPSECPFPQRRRSEGPRQRRKPHRNTSSPLIYRLTVVSLAGALTDWGAPMVADGDAYAIPMPPGHLCRRALRARGL
jgi:hypothetical protein